MSRTILVWDLETVADLACVARVHGIDPADETACREALGERFPKAIFHQIVCIGMLVAERTGDGWEIRSLEAAHIGEFSEAELIQRLVAEVEQLRPQLVTFNGASFDLPVLRYRAMLNRVSAPGLSLRPYFHRYTDDAVDLCDVLASFDARCRIGLHELCCAIGVPGKRAGIDAANIDQYRRGGRMSEVADYCAADAIATFRLWLAYEHFRGHLNTAALTASESRLGDFVQGRPKWEGASSAMSVFPIPRPPSEARPAPPVDTVS